MCTVAVNARSLYLAHMGPYCSPVGEINRVERSGKGESVPAGRPTSLFCRSAPFPRARFRPDGIGGLLGEEDPVCTSSAPPPRSFHHDIQPQGVLDDNPSFVGH